MRSSSRTRVAVRPSLQCAFTMPITYDKARDVARKVALESTALRAPALCDNSRLCQVRVVPKSEGLHSTNYLWKI